MQRTKYVLVIALSAALPSGATTGCSCDMDCAQAGIEILIDGGIGSVEVCDSAGECVVQDFGEADPLVASRSFTMFAPGNARDLHVRALSPGGTELVDEPVDIRFEDAGECECTPNARLFITADGVTQLGG